VRQVISERQQCRVLVIAQRGRLFVLQALDLLLEPRKGCQAFIPSAFELPCDEPVIGINRIILPARMCRFVVRFKTG
jgi:hypothetical protein